MQLVYNKARSYSILLVGGHFLFFQNMHVTDPYSYIEDQSGDRSEPLYVDHGQSVWKVTLTGAHKEQPEHNTHELGQVMQQAE